jgi:cell division protein FtsB
VNINLPDTDDIIVRHSFYSQLSGKVECLEDKVDCNLNTIHATQGALQAEIRILEENDIESQTTMKVARIAILGVWLIFSGIISWGFTDAVETIAKMEKQIDALSLTNIELTKKVDNILYKRGNGTL